MVLQILKKNNRSKRVDTLVDSIKSYIGSNSFLESSFDPVKIKSKFSSIENSNSSSPICFYISGIKDLISNTDGIVTGGSQFLKEYKPPYNSTVYKELCNCNVLNVVNTNLDEFGLGGTGLSGFNGYIGNPHDPERMIGGSSSGSSFLVSKKVIDFSVVTDTGDSSRKPASYSGIIGFKPSFGEISRYGFYPFCSGMDTPSIMSNSMEVVIKVFSCLSYFDAQDLCTVKSKKRDFSHILKIQKLKPIRIAIFKDTFWKIDKSETDRLLVIENKFFDFIEKLKNEYEIIVNEYEFPLQLLKLAELVYFIVSSVESVSNYSNMTGLLFPFNISEDNSINFSKLDSGKNYDEILLNNRSVFGDEFVFRQLMGRHFIEGKNYDEIYLKSKRILSLFNEEIKKVFQMYDLVISPTTDDIPEKIKEYKKTYSPSNIKNILLLANFCSLPAISIPWEIVDNMPIGLHLMSEYKSDEFLLTVSNIISSFISKKVCPQQ